MRRGRRRICWVAWIALAGAGPMLVGAEPQPSPASRPQAAWRPIGQLDPVVIQEASGVVQSRRDPEVFWTHGDSGNAAKLVAFKLDGTIVAEVIVDEAPNIDWEDICADDAGHLYIGDLGNNTGLLPVRYIYQLTEPDPNHPPEQPVQPVRRWRVRYPDAERFNCESLLWRDGALYAFGRTQTSKAAFYRLVENDGGDLVFTKNADLQAVSVAGADASSDGQQVVVCNSDGAIVVRWPDGAEAFDAASPTVIRYRHTSGLESCCFAGADLVLVNEAGKIYRITAADIAAQTQFTGR